MGDSGASFLERLDPLRPRTIDRPYSVSWQDRHGRRRITKFADEDSASGFRVLLGAIGATEVERVDGDSD